MFLSTGRRRWLLAALLAAVMLIAAACGDSPPASEGDGTGGAAEEKSLVIVQGTDIEGLDIHRVTASPSYAVLDHIIETLFKITPEGDVVEGLATGFEVGPEGNTYTITLREGISFSDGEPFNAEAVKANLERIQDPESEAAYATLIEPIYEINVVDEYTVELKSEHPFGPIQLHLAHPGISMMSPKVLAEGNDYIAANPVGTGPFLLDEWKQGEQVVLRRNDGYWAGLPPLNEIVFRVVLDDGARLIELEAGTADVAIRVPPSEASRVENNADLVLDETPGLRTIYVYFNTTMPPFDDARVRQAFNYAVDNEAIAEDLLLGAARASDAPMAPPVFGYSAQTPYARDLDKARQLLEEANFDFDQTIVFHHPTGRYVQDARIAEAIRAHLAEVGVKVELETFEWGAYIDYVTRPVEENEVHLGFLGWGVATVDADYALYEMFHSSQWPGAGFNLGFYKNDEVDRLLTLGRSTADADERLAAYAEAQKIIWEDSPWVWLHSEVQLTGLRGSVTGFEVHPTERYIANWADKQ